QAALRVALEPHGQAYAIFSRCIDSAEVELPDAVHEAGVQIDLVGDVVDEAGQLPIGVCGGVDRARVPSPDIAGRRVARTAVDIGPEVGDLRSPEVTVIVPAQAHQQAGARPAERPVVLSPNVVGFLGCAAELGVLRKLRVWIYVDVCRVEPAEIRPESQPVRR